MAMGAVPWFWAMVATLSVTSIRSARRTAGASISIAPNAHARTAPTVSTQRTNYFGIPGMERHSRMSMTALGALK